MAVSRFDGSGEQFGTTDLSKRDGIFSKPFDDGIKVDWMYHLLIIII